MKGKFLPYTYTKNNNKWESKRGNSLPNVFVKENPTQTHIYTHPISSCQEENSRIHFWMYFTELVLDAGKMKTKAKVHSKCIFQFEIIFLIEFLSHRIYFSANNILNIISFFPLFPNWYTIYPSSQDRDRDMYWRRIE